MRCPYCGQDPVIYPNSETTVVVVCHGCGRGPDEVFNEDSIADGSVLEYWTMWAKAAMKRRIKHIKKMSKQ